MLNVNLGLLVGACVIRKETWDKIPAASREPLKAAAERAGKEIRANSRKENTEAVAAMQKRGLIVHEVSPEAVEQWRKEAEKMYPDIRGKLVPDEIFDDVLQQLQTYRASAPNK
jgi:TRAP-type C4-dicarboxylate transport system substrate-binding protein